MLHRQRPLVPSGSLDLDVRRDGMRCQHRPPSMVNCERWGAEPEVERQVAANSRRWWRNSAMLLSSVLDIAWFDRTDYPDCHDLNFSNRPVRTRMPGGVVRSAMIGPSPDWASRRSQRDPALTARAWGALAGWQSDLGCHRCQALRPRKLRSSHRNAMQLSAETLLR